MLASRGMGFLGELKSLTSAQRTTFAACFLGWTLDAFDFFLLTVCLRAIAADFHVGIPQIAEAIFWTLVMRPLGALIFGMLAERYGRRPTLIINIICFSIFELASAFAPTLGIFLVCRALFGIAMGGEWGVGAALALESLPARGRGFFSGLLQEGYVVGNLLAAALYGVLFPHLHGTGMLTGWRVMFMIGALPALLAFYMQFKVEESPTWLEAQRRRRSEGRAGSRVSFQQFRQYLPTFLFLVLLMTAFNSFSHGTQDLYPTLLEKDHALDPGRVGFIVVISNIGAMLGGIVCGALSERLGRKRMIIIAALCSIPMIPLWAWSHTVPALALGGFLMQFAVQGAFGVIPAHLNELAPGPVRAVFPGVTYQLGNLVSSRNGVFQARLAQHFSGGALNAVMSWTVVVGALSIALVTGLGREARGEDWSVASEDTAVQRESAIDR
ncbi:MFS transporter [Edaphobacter modestus]|uniref:SHS family lactate transporter-like MFS transporter n=1 Tax=Edaphobacter modestus TaxID=388466 RepID=A0A4Q7Z1H0_9BACT|nr:MFS transporter [Edaphobacter modestus]RZU43491.1 SHS family lactate transporter-like MFS transporter [Edaphobacter modestus]